MELWLMNGISSAFDVVIVTGFYAQRLGFRRKKYVTYLIGVILCAVMTTVSSVFTGTPIVPVSVFAAFICYSLVFCGELHTKIFNAATVFLSMILGELFTGILLMTIHHGNLDYIQNNPIFYLQGAILSKLFMFIELSIFRLFKERDYSLVNRKTVLSLSIITISSIASVYFIAMYVYNTHNIIESAAALAVTIIVAISFICTFYIFNVIIKSERKTALLAAERLRYEREIAMYKQDNEHRQEIRRLNHDMKNLLIGVDGALSAMDIDEAHRMISEYLKCCCDISEKSGPVSGNSALDYIVSAKKTEAEELGIVFHYDIAPFDVQISETDICILLGNILDNAIEACEQLSSEKTIELKMRCINGMLYISCKNPTEQNDVSLLTTKSDKEQHGFGTVSINKIANKYGGYANFKIEEGLFVCEIIIPQQISVS